MLMQSACCVCLSDHLGNHKCVFFMFLHIRLWVGGGLEGRRGGGLRKKVGMCYICPTLQCALCIKCSRLISCLEAGTLSKKCKQTPPSISIRGSTALLKHWYATPPCCRKMYSCTGFKRMCIVSPCRLH